MFTLLCMYYTNMYMDPVRGRSGVNYFCIMRRILSRYDPAQSRVYFVWDKLFSGKYKRKVYSTTYFFGLDLCQFYSKY